VLFIGNYYNEAHTGRIYYTHPGTGETVTIPYSSESAEWPGLYGVLSPLGLEVAEGLKIMHCTSDILGIEEKNGHWEIILYGERDLPGEIVFEGPGFSRIKGAEINGTAVKMLGDSKRIAFNYNHKHREEFILRLLIH
jgi:hypothetical protein